MLRYLTHKLKTQSLNEADSIPSKNDDDHDSGTESDDEGADAEELEKYMDDSLQCDVSSSISAPSDRASSTLDTITEDITTEVRMPSSDSCPALPSDSDANHHSSEEELEVINCNAAARSSFPEKRKWSQANVVPPSSSRNPPRGRSSCASSDDEVRDLMCASAPVEFRASPPANVPKPSRSLSPPPKLFHQDLDASAATIFPPHELLACSASPRKRHRRSTASTNTTTSTSSTTNTTSAVAAANATSNNASSTTNDRPSLDFEKMQQKQKLMRKAEN